MVNEDERLDGEVVRNLTAAGFTTAEVANMLGVAEAAVSRKLLHVN